MSAACKTFRGNLSAALEILAKLEKAQPQDGATVPTLCIARLN